MGHSFAFQILWHSVVRTFIISESPCLCSSAGTLSVPGDFPPFSVRNASCISYSITCISSVSSTAGFTFQYAGIWSQFVTVEILAILVYNYQLSNFNSTKKNVYVINMYRSLVCGYGRRRFALHCGTGHGPQLESIRHYNNK